MNDLGNITAAMTQAGLGLKNELVMAWDIWTRGLAAGRWLTLLDQSAGLSFGDAPWILFLQSTSWSDS